jgi:S-layer homology domain
MRPSTPDSAPAERPRRRLRRTLAGLAVGALAIPAVVTAVHAFTDVPPGSPAYRDINAIADAGLMSGFNGEFKPDQAVTRRLLAQVLHRGLHRLSIDETIDDITVGQPDPPVIGEVPMFIEGFQRGNQGVLLQLDMQVEAAQPIAADCDVLLDARSFPENLPAGTWTFRMYAGERGATVHATFIAGQLAGTFYTYDVSADSNCGPLHVVQGSWTAESIAFQGNGAPFPEG